MSQFITTFLRFLGMATLCLTQSAFGQTVTLNFNAYPTGSRDGFASVLCNMPGIPNISCETGFGFSPSGTDPFVQEFVQIGGELYYHLIVGQPTDGFAQEVLIKTLTTVRFIGGASSDSGGLNCFTNDLFTCAGSPNNGRSPLASDPVLSGNGSGNPNRVIVRQVMSDSAGTFSQEFLKANLTTKPVITQELTTSDIIARFVLDMSGIDYNTNTVAGLLTNTVRVLDLDIPQLAGDYDSATHAQTFAGTGTNIDSNITGGRYIYTPDTNQFFGGIYTYYDGDYPIADVNWESFRDPAQN